jgi:hypothetical protein
VADPQHPKYGPAFDPNAGGGNGQPDPDAGKDFGYLVPNVQVAWSTPPSFNQDPPDVTPPGGDGDKDNDVPACGPIQVNLGTLRTAEQSMLSASRIAVTDYEALRNKVMSVKDTVFGQTATVTEVTGGPDGVSGNSYNGAGAGVRQESTVASPVQEAAKKFSDSINPAQEKVLWQVANTIEIIGQYIAAVNRSGQAYGHADRESVFPEPPQNPVTGT